MASGSMVQDRPDGTWANFKTHENGKKTGIYLKVTDSVIRALEQYQSQERPARNPTIRVDGDHGIISIPSLSRDSDYLYTFSLSKIHQDTLPFTQTDILHSDLTGGRCSQVRTVGKVKEKATIQAKDDSYHATSQKIKQVDEEQKKNCTKVLKDGGPHMSSIRKKIYRPQSQQHQSYPHQIPSAPRPTASGLSTSISPSLLPSSTTISPPLSTSSSASNASSLSPHSGINGTGVSSSYSISRDKSSSSSSHHRQLNGFSNKTVSKLPVTGNLDVQKRPLRERIVHLLALKPYRYPELYLRLMKDGLRDKDGAKDEMSQVLSDVASDKNSTYTLKKEIFSEVEPDWAFYSPIDKQLLKRNLPPSFTSPSPGGAIVSPGASSTSSSHSPTSTTLHAPPPPPPSSHSHHPHSHANNLLGPSSCNQKRPSSLATVGLDIDSGYPSYKQRRISPGSKENFPSNGLSSAHASPDSQKSPKSWALMNGHHTIKKEEDSKFHGVHSAESSPSPSSTTVNPDYLLKYQRIVTDEQREQYKCDFNLEYKEYRELYDYVAKVAEKFSQLRAKLDTVDEGTAEYESVKEHIQKEYFLINRDEAYGERKRRWIYLTEKLEHIKTLIGEYDENMLPGER